MRFMLTTGMVIFSLLLATNASAHCDTMDGPVIRDAKTAIAKNNLNYVLKWVHSDAEAELREVFNLSMKVRNHGTDAQKLADMYFFETLIRLHRNGEGVSYTGLKPSGTPVDRKILLADEAIEKNNLQPLDGVIPHERFHELEERFQKVISLKNFDPDNVEAGREYVEAYVSFFKFAEGEEAAHHAH